MDTPTVPEKRGLSGKDQGRTKGGPRGTKGGSKRQLCLRSGGAAGKIKEGSREDQGRIKAPTVPEKRGRSGKDQGRIKEGPSEDQSANCA